MLQRKRWRGPSEVHAGSKYVMRSHQINAPLDGWMEGSLKCALKDYLYTGWRVDMYNVSSCLTVWCNRQQV